MSDVVTYSVPDEHGETMVHQQSAIVPDVGERIWVDIEHNDTCAFIVTNRRYELNPSPNDENKTHVVVELEELSEHA